MFGFQNNQNIITLTPNDINTIREMTANLEKLLANNVQFTPQESQALDAFVNIYKSRNGNFSTITVDEANVLKVVNEIIKNKISSLQRASTNFNNINGIGTASAFSSFQKTNVDNSAFMSIPGAKKSTNNNVNNTTTVPNINANTNTNNKVSLEKCFEKLGKPLEVLNKLNPARYEDIYPPFIDEDNEKVIVEFISEDVYEIAIYDKINNENNDLSFDF